MNPKAKRNREGREDSEAEPRRCRQRWTRWLKREGSGPSNLVPSVLVKVAQSGGNEGNGWKKWFSDGDASLLFVG